MTALVVSRAQAGLPAPRSISHSIIDRPLVTFHYGGDALGGYPWPHARCSSIWRAWCDFHRSKGWSDIAYSLGACIHGFVYVGRGSGVRTAAQGTNDGNNRSYAVVYIAGAGEPVTDVGWNAMLDARAILQAGAKPATTEVRPHNYWHSTSCPGDEIEQRIAAGVDRVPVVWAPPAQPKIGTPAAAFASTPSGRGYIVVGTDGGVFTFGDAMYFGSLPEISVVPNAPIVSAEITPSGGGYVLAGADGGIYTFGDARYAGSLGGVHLNAPVDELRLTPAAAGYWMQATDGGIFTFGDAVFAGSPA